MTESESALFAAQNEHPAHFAARFEPQNEQQKECGESARH